MVVEADALVPFRNKDARLPAPGEGVQRGGHQPLVGEGHGREGQEAREPAGGAEGAELHLPEQGAKRAEPGPHQGRQPRRRHRRRGLPLPLRADAVGGRAVGLEQLHGLGVGNPPAEDVVRGLRDVRQLRQHLLQGQEARPLREFCGNCTRQSTESRAPDAQSMLACLP